jgi:hypothetical protein
LIMGHALMGSNHQTKTHRKRFRSLAPDRTSGNHPHARDTAINRDI